MARSIAGQSTLLQKETTPGTALVNAMLRVEALKMRPTFVGAAEPFMGLTGKAATSVTLPDLRADWSAEAVQCFNAIGLVAASRMSVPVTMTPGGATLARQHIFTILADSADAFRTYTAQYGDATQAMQAIYGVFQSLGLHIKRGALELTTSFMSREPATGATLATTGVTTMAAKPIPPTRYDVWADDTWAALGTTKLTSVYRMNVDLGDKYTPDSPINSAITGGYESALESVDQGYGGNGVFGFDSVAVGLIATFKAGSRKYFRVKVTTADFIEATTPWSLQMDFAAFLTSVGEVNAWEDSPATVLSMDMAPARDSVTGKVCELTLINTITAY